jgi:NAD+ diphosphatase
MSEVTGEQGSTLAFTGAVLERAASDRGDAVWLERQRVRTDARALVLSERGLWVEDGHLLLVAPEPGAVFLGLDGDRPLFATYGERDRGHPAGLREAATELPADEAALGAYAASLLSWHRRHGFCANCGAETEVIDGGHERRCPACDTHHFPRTDPVVIVRVVDRRDRLLLGRQASWPERRFSVLAGFVEPGETLEEAVKREVREEVGVDITNVAYVASQPWPFPHSLMLGFTADWAGGDIVIDPTEIVDAQWFRADDMPPIPPGISIARKLIDGWLHAVAGR